eukprot:scaffold9242_cov91-Cyclotella_meneghiniana.AAC.1
MSSPCVYQCRISSVIVVAMSYIVGYCRRHVRYIVGYCRRHVRTKSPVFTVAARFAIFYCHVRTKSPTKSPVFTVAARFAIFYFVPVNRC